MIFRSSITLPEQAMPATPDAGLGVLYPKSGGGWYILDQAGSERRIDGPWVIDRTTADLDIVNTITETSLYAVTIPGSSLWTDRCLTARVECDYLNNTAGARAHTVILKLGATVIYEETTVALSQNASRRCMRFEVWLANKGATNSQIGGVVYSVSSSGPATTGAGDMTLDDFEARGISILGTADTTVDQTLDLRIVLGSASASYSMRRRYASAQIV